MCQAGRNTIQITVSACCCSHLFVLQLVHRFVLLLLLLLGSTLVRESLFKNKLSHPQAECAVGASGAFEEAAAASGALHHQDQAQLQLPSSHQVACHNGDVDGVAMEVDRCTF